VSDPALPDSPSGLAFRDLEILVRNLGEELSAFRKRAHAAEARLKALGATPSGDASAEERVAALDAENARLRSRLAEAGTRTRTMLDRVRFLRQQHVLEHVLGGDA
jgi:predicted RNase H-like nuclease (RuvC/YqgF family)